MSDYSPLVLFWMECGCARTFEELNRKQNPYTCPCLDKGRIAYRTTECKVCHVRFEFKRTGPVPVYCPACKVELGIYQRSTVETPIHSDPYVAGHPNAIASAEREDCIYRLECLDEYSRLDKQFLPCLGCKRYISRKEKI